MTQQTNGSRSRSLRRFSQRATAARIRRCLGCRACGASPPRSRCREIPQAHGRREDRSDDLSPLVFGQCGSHCPDCIEVTADFFNRAGELVKQRPALYQDQAAAPHRSRVPAPKAGARPGPQPPANKPRPADDSPEEDPTSPPARGNSGRLIPHPIPINFPHRYD